MNHLEYVEGIFNPFPIQQSMVAKAINSKDLSVGSFFQLRLGNKKKLATTILMGYSRRLIEFHT